MTGTAAATADTNHLAGPGQADAAQAVIGQAAGQEAWCAGPGLVR